MQRWGGCGVGFYPIAVAGGEVEVGVVLEAQAHGVQAGVGRLGMEAEHVAVGDVVGDGFEIALQGPGVFEVEVFAAGELGYGFRDVALEAAHAGDDRHFGESQRRGEQAEAVVGLIGELLGGSTLGRSGCAG